jgi:benzoate-CoA ligase family protein
VNDTGASGNAAHHLLDRNLEAGRGGEVCVRTFDEQLTFEQLHRASCRSARAFEAAGIDWEHRVVLILPDGPALMAAVLGLLRIGAVPVPLSTQLAADDYARIIADCRPRGALVSPAHAGAVESARAGCGFPRVTWVSGGETGDHESWEACVGQAPGECPLRPTSIDDAAVIQYTSGSTGAPKGVVHLHRGLVALSSTFATRLRLGPDDVCFSAAKMSFGYGFGNSLLMPYPVGAGTILLGGQSTAPRVLEVVERLRPTVLFAVPTLYSAMLEVAGRHPEVGLGRVRACVSAGEPLPPTVAARWVERFGVEIHNGLGSTECLHIFISTEPGRTPRGTMGTVVPGFAARLLDEGGAEVAPGEVGHLWIRGDPNGARYWNRHPETVATMVGPWTRTGDLLWRDEQDVYSFVSRSDDVLKVEGLKVSPTEIEDALLTHPAVGECAVIGVPGAAGVTTLRAYVRLADGLTAGDGLAGELRRHLQARLAVHKCPRHYELVADLPRTPTGKVSRHRLREMASQS